MIGNSLTFRPGIAYVQGSPLVWALPLQALLLLWNLDLLDPWGDEWFTLFAASQPLERLTSVDPMHPPFYYGLVHLWRELPIGLSEVAQLRSMSVAWALIATGIVYAVWLRQESPRLQAMFLALWVLSPTLLLHSRMARSYSMQLALASLAIFSALKLADQPRNWRWALAYVGATAALLYTHYLSGLAVAGGIGVSLLIKGRIGLAVGLSAVLAVLYAPWLPTLGAALLRWNGASAGYPYEGGSFISDQIVRAAYLFWSFSFGETVSTVTLVLGVVLTPVMIYAAAQGVKDKPPWLILLLPVTVIAWVGVSRYGQFVFTPSHLLFVLPFFLLLVVRHLRPVAFAALLLLYAGADLAYFTKSGFLVKPYAAPYREMADVIRKESAGQEAVVLVSSFGAFSQPLLSYLGNDVQIIELADEESTRKMQTLAGGGGGSAPIIWLWRRTSDISPDAFVTKLEAKLNADREARRYEFVRYSAPERWARRLLRGPGQSDYYYSLSEFR